MSNLILIKILAYLLPLSLISIFKVYLFRTRAMPHIKTYTRLDADNEKMAYFLLTSGLKYKFFYLIS